MQDNKRKKAHPQKSEPKKQKHDTISLLENQEEKFMKILNELKKQNNTSIIDQSREQNDTMILNYSAPVEQVNEITINEKDDIEINDIEINTNEIIINEKDDIDINTNEITINEKDDIDINTNEITINEKNNIELNINKNKNENNNNTDVTNVTNMTSTITADEVNPLESQYVLSSFEKTLINRSSMYLKKYSTWISYNPPEQCKCTCNVLEKDLPKKRSECIIDGTHENGKYIFVAKNGGIWEKYQRDAIRIGRMIKFENGKVRSTIALSVTYMKGDKYVTLGAKINK